MSDKVTTARPNSPSVTPRHKAALAASINAVLAQSAMLDAPRQYVTDADAGLIVSLSAILSQVNDVEGGTKMTAKQTQGNSTETTASAAVERALQESE